MDYIDSISLQSLGRLLEASLTGEVGQSAAPGEYEGGPFVDRGLEIRALATMVTVYQRKTKRDRQGSRCMDGQQWSTNEGRTMSKSQQDQVEHW
jgi:hypothetical protein